MAYRSTRGKDKQRLAADQLREDWRWFMGTAGGRRLMWGWLAEAGIYRSTFNGTRSGDFLEGKRAFGLMLVDSIRNLAPEAWALMHAENTAVPEVKRAEIEADDD